MAVCKYCGKVMAWGHLDGRWVSLVPLGEEAGLDRGYQDEDGNLRAAHRLVCVGPGTVKVAKLAKPIPASSVMSPKFDVDPETGEITSPLPTRDGTIQHQGDACES